jgi:hypothetical protein
MQSATHFDFDAIKAQLSERVKPTTAEDYIRGFKKLAFGSFDLDAIEDLTIEDFRNIDDVFTYIESDAIPMNTRKNLANHALQVLRCVDADTFSGIDELVGQYEARFRAITEVVHAHRVMAGPSAALMQNIQRHPTMESVVQIREAYKLQMDTARDRSNTVKYLILTLVTRLPVLRTQDYTNIEFSDVELDVNHINSVTRELVLFTGKTAARMGVRRVAIPDDVFDIILECKEYLNTKWLIPVIRAEKLGDVAMSTDATSSLMCSIGVGSRFMRQLDTAGIVENGSIADIAEHARTVGHSLETELIHYTKLNERMHPRGASTPTIEDSRSNVANAVTLHLEMLNNRVHQIAQQMIDMEAEKNTLMSEIEMVQKLQL